jgi:hypothetical protein
MPQQIDLANRPAQSQSNAGKTAGHIQWTELGCYYDDAVSIVAQAKSRIIVGNRHGDAGISTRASVPFDRQNERRLGPGYRSPVADPMPSPTFNGRRFAMPRPRIRIERKARLEYERNAGPEQMMTAGQCSPRRGPAPDFSLRGSADRRLREFVGFPKWRTETVFPSGLGIRVSGPEVSSPRKGSGAACGGLNQADARALGHLPLSVGGWGGAEGNEV